MRVALCLMGIIIGALLFSAGFVANSPWLLLAGFVLLPLAAIYGSQPANEPEHHERGSHADHSNRTQRT